MTPDPLVASRFFLASSRDRLRTTAAVFLAIGLGLALLPGCAERPPEPPPPPASTPAPPAPVDALGPVAWLEGRWVADGADTTTVETWTREGAALIGRSETTRGGDVVFWEALRIEAKDGALSYAASPLGNAAVPFAVEVRGDGFAASNPDHDFPQLIVYRRDGDGLVAWIGATGQTEGQAAARWAFARR